MACWDRHVVPYYVNDGRPTPERDNIRQALRLLRRLHGPAPAREFGPQALKLVRAEMVCAGRCWTLVNKDVNRVRALFRWAAEEELYPGGAYQALRAVQALARGRSDARERPPVGPVDPAVVEATLPGLTAPVVAMVRLQLLTRARPGEVAAIRPREVDLQQPRRRQRRRRPHPRRPARVLHPRPLPLPAAALEHLERLIDPRPPAVPRRVGGPGRQVGQDQPRPLVPRLPPRHQRAVQPRRGPAVGLEAAALRHFMVHPLQALAPGTYRRETATARGSVP